MEEVVGLFAKRLALSETEVEVVIPDDLLEEVPRKGFCLWVPKSEPPDRGRIVARRLEDGRRLLFSFKHAHDLRSVLEGRPWSFDKALIVMAVTDGRQESAEDPFRGGGGRRFGLRRPKRSGWVMSAPELPVAGFARTRDEMEAGGVVEVSRGNAEMEVDAAAVEVDVQPGKRRRLVFGDFPMKVVALPAGDQGMEKENCLVESIPQTVVTGAGVSEADLQVASLNFDLNAAPIKGMNMHDLGSGLADGAFSAPFASNSNSALNRRESKGAAGGRRAGWMPKKWERPP